jgi:hypothetical protein
MASMSQLAVFVESSDGALSLRSGSVMMNHRMKWSNCSQQTRYTKGRVAGFKKDVDSIAY